MCYKKPGPRCSGHAAEALAKAYQEKDPEKLQKALYDFRHTNQGIEQMAQADPEYAEVLKQERQEMLDALHRQEEMERTYRQDSQEVESTFLSDEDLTQNVPQSPGFSRSAEGASISGRESLVSHVQSEGARLGEFVNLRLNNYYGQDYEVTGSLQKEDNSDRVYVLDNHGNEYEVYSSMNNNFTPHTFSSMQYIEKEGFLARI